MSRDAGFTGSSAGHVVPTTPLVGGVSLQTKKASFAVDVASLSIESRDGSTTGESRGQPAQKRQKRSLFENESSRAPPTGSTNGLASSGEASKTLPAHTTLRYRPPTIASAVERQTADSSALVQACAHLASRGDSCMCVADVLNLRATSKILRGAVEDNGMLQYPAFRAVGLKRFKVLLASQVSATPARCVVEQFKLTAADTDGPLKPILWACEGIGSVAVVRYVAEIFGLTAGDVDDNLMRAVCRRGHVEVLDFLLKHIGVDPEHFFPSCFFNACAGGFKSIAAVLVDTLGNSARESMQPHIAHALRLACISGSLELVQWMVAKFNITPNYVVQFESEGSLDATEDSDFPLSFSAGNMVSGSMAFADMDMRRRCRRSCPWAASCWSGNQAIADWLQERFNIPAALLCTGHRPSIEEALASLHEGCWVRSAIIMRDVEAWEVRKACVTQRRSILAAFDAVCRDGHMSALRWMTEPFGLGQTSVARRNRHAPFLAVCASGDVKTADWFVNVFDMDISDSKCNDGQPLRDAIRRSDEDMVRWLLERFSLNEVDVRPHVADICEHMSLDFVSWLDAKVNLTRDSFRDLGDHLISESFFLWGRLDALLDKRRFSTVLWLARQHNISFSPSHFWLKFMDMAHNDEVRVAVWMADHAKEIVGPQNGRGGPSSITDIRRYRSGEATEQLFIRECSRSDGRLAVLRSMAKLGMLPDRLPCHPVIATPSVRSWLNVHAPTSAQQ